MSGQCRFCRDYDGEGHGTLLKYGVRHYAHVECGLKAKGAAFFEHFTDWQLSHAFPYLAVIKFGLEKEFAARCDAIRLRELKRQAALCAPATKLLPKAALSVKSARYELLEKPQAGYRIGAAYEVWQFGVMLSRHPNKPEAENAIKRYRKADRRAGIAAARQKAGQS
jgi:hypothetical protein